MNNNDNLLPFRMGNAIETRSWGPPALLEQRGAHPEASRWLWMFLEGSGRRGIWCGSKCSGIGAVVIRPLFDAWLASATSNCAPLVHCVAAARVWPLRLWSRRNRLEVRPNQSNSSWSTGCNGNVSNRSHTRCDAWEGSRICNPRSNSGRIASALINPSRRLCFVDNIHQLAFILLKYWFIIAIILCYLFDIITDSKSWKMMGKITVKYSMESGVSLEKIQ